jgi:hypothetical protein
MRGHKSVSILLLLALFAVSIGANCQTKKELKKEFNLLKQRRASFQNQINQVVQKKKEAESSLEILIDDFTGGTVIVTKPKRGLSTPEIQMLAKKTIQDTLSVYQIGLELFTKSTAVNADKLYIKSTRKVHEFDVTKENFNVESTTVDASVNWGWGIKTGTEYEVFANTYFLDIDENDFFEILGSKEIKVRFSDKGVPDKDVSKSDILKMNNLYTYLTSDQRIDMLNKQLREVLNRLYEVEKLLESI